MTPRATLRRVTRRRFLKASGRGALLTSLAGGGLIGKALAQAEPPGSLPRMDIRQVATDGFFSFPGRRRADDNGIFGFGFRGVLDNETFADVGFLTAKYKFMVQWPSPILAIPKNIELYLTMSNLGFEIRPDLDDAHTIHWHGFRNPNAIFDGVPEVSISVPPGRDFPYFYRPRVEGTYMYHCHFEDTEHVQLGMDGVVYIEAETPPPAGSSFLGRAYDGDGDSTLFHRQFTLLLNEVDQSPHDLLANVQEFVWSDYEPDYWLINGRSYPDTIVRDQELFDHAGGDFRLPDAGGVEGGPEGGAFDPDLGFSQPVSSLIQVEEGETALLRIVNLGYEQHAMQLLGPRMRVVGRDATFLGGQAFETGTTYLGPGETADALVMAPAFDPGLPGQVDPEGRPYNRYWLRNRGAQRLVNGRQSGLGGMATQMWVYPGGTLPPQSGPNVTV